MLRQISPGQVRLGMYVRGFGGRWRDHPFWRVRFVLKNPDDVELVRQSGVPYVIIDDERGLGVATEAPMPAAAAATAPAPAAKPLRISSQPRGSSIAVDYDQARERSDKQRARALVERSMKILRRTFTDVRLGRAVRMPEVTAVVEDVIETVERSPRTLLETLRLKNKDDYTYLHSVAVCTLMVNAAQHMNKSAEQVREFGMAGLLHDLGKMGISDDILNKPGSLTDAEFEKIRHHPEHGFQILSQSPDMPEAALDVCRHHHEKMDGTGYPFGLPAEAISLVARLGAVCDVYDALTSDRSYKDAWSPKEAVAAMWSWDGHFDRDILFSFMRSIGVFPTGVLVQLRSNRLAIVLDAKRRHPGPRVLAFYATRDREFLEPEEVLIKDNLENDSVVAFADPADWGFTDWDALSARLLRGETSRIAA